MVKITTSATGKGRKSLEDFNVGDLVRGGDAYWHFLAIVVDGPDGRKTLLTLESDDHEIGSSPAFSLES